MTMIKTSTYDVLCEALTTLAGRCNGAITRDDVGFNGSDTGLGKSLADFICRGGQMTEGQQAAAIKMIQKYRNQLAGCGVDIPSINDYIVKPLPKLGPAPVGSTPASKPVVQPDQTIDAMHGELVVSFKFNQSVYGKIKALPYKQRRYEADPPRWYVHPSQHTAIKNIMPHAHITPAAQSLITKQGNTPAPVDPFAITLESGQLVLRFEPNPGLLDRVRALPERAFKKELPGWIVPARLVDDVIKAFPDAQMSVEVMDLAESQAKLASKASAMASTVNKLGIDLSKPINGMTLFAHQQADIANMLNNGSLILAGEVGTGKSYTLMVAASIWQKQYGYKVIVITKASLKDDIKRSADKVGVDIEVYSWAKIPKPPNAPYIMIADEAHMAQGAAKTGKAKTIRGQAFLDLAEHSNCIVCWPATGTPMRNGKPINLWPLLRAVKASCAMNKRKYEAMYCDAKATHFTQWDTSGASRLEELNALCKPLIIRRKKIDCLDLPPQMLNIRQITLSSASQTRFDETFAIARKDYEQRKQAKIEMLQQELANNPDNQQAASNLANIDAADAMVMLGQLRRANSIAKVEEAIELAQEILEQDSSSVVISCEFLESAELIYTALKEYKAELLTGSVTGNEPGQKISRRQAMIDRFQAKQSRVFVMTGSAGGTGVTLTAAQDMILVDRPMVPDEVEQLHGRLHRITQTGTVSLHWLQAGEIDQKIDENLLGKSNNSSQVVDGKSQSDLAREIIKALFTPNK